MRTFLIILLVLTCATMASAQQSPTTAPHLAVQQQYAERVATLQAALDAALKERDALKAKLDFCTRYQTAWPTAPRRPTPSKPSPETTR